jgi:hypothetical protein
MLEECPGSLLQIGNGVEKMAVWCTTFAMTLTMTELWLVGRTGVFLAERFPPI